MRPAMPADDRSTVTLHRHIVRVVRGRLSRFDAECQRDTIQEIWVDVLAARRAGQRVDSRCLATLVERHVKRAKRGVVRATRADTLGVDAPDPTPAAAARAVWDTAYTLQSVRPDFRLESSESGGEAHRFLTARLTATQYEILRSRMMMGMSVLDTANHLCLSDNVIKNETCRSLRRLRRLGKSGPLAEIVDPMGRLGAVVELLGHLEAHPSPG